MDEIALAEPVLDELVGGAGIRHPQQRFREHHQRQALLGGERKLPKHVLDAAEPVVTGTDGADQPRRRAIDPRVLFPAQGARLREAGPPSDYRPARRPPRMAEKERDRMSSHALQVPVHYHAAGLGIAKPLR